VLISGTHRDCRRSPLRQLREHGVLLEDGVARLNLEAQAKWARGDG
jgi:hypothetical protein